MVVVAQWQSSRLWSWLLRVRVPSITPFFYFSESHSRSRVTFVNMLKKSRAFFLVEGFVVGAGETGI